MTESKAVKALEEKIDIFLQEYVSNSRYTPKKPKDRKIIHDSLWGTIVVQPWEIEIIDLPLIQRLRQIRQTSLTNYVFPGCTHSRFEHTLGVLLQTQKLIDAINSQRIKKPFSIDDISDLRLAAIFHDCGHGPFSHISENIYENCSDMAKVINEKDGEFQNYHPHEVFSSLILRSKRVQNYIKSLNKRYHIRLNPKRASKWIVGDKFSRDSNNLYYGQVINGPFDADKLDYIFRDAHYSGLPLALDLHRLWASCKIDTRNRDKIITLHQSSATPLEQIIFNKINLFTVVYQHPKVRAAECMFQGVIEYIHENNHAIRNKTLKKAVDFLWVTDDIFFSEALRQPKNSLVHMMIHDILYRRHFVRALTICKDTIKVRSQGTEYEHLRLLNQIGYAAFKERRKLAKKIWERAGKPFTYHHIWLDLPSDPPIGEANRTFVQTSSGKPRKLSDLFPIGYWAEFYKNYKWRGHVFCPSDCQQEVYEASKDVFNECFGLEFKRSAGESSHVPHP